MKTENYFAKCILVRDNEDNRNCYVAKTTTVSYKPLAVACMCLCFVSHGTGTHHCSYLTASLRHFFYRFLCFISAFASSHFVFLLHITRNHLRRRRFRREHLVQSIRCIGLLYFMHFVDYIRCYICFNFVTYLSALWRCAQGNKSQMNSLTNSWV